MNHFIGEPIQPECEDQYRPTKKIGCPVAFQWRGDRHLVTELIREWHDYSRKGDASRNMQAAHAKAASRHGSRGVGRDYYHVRTQEGREFIFYYDRAPKDLDHPSGVWILRDEIIPLTNNLIGSQEVAD